MPETDKLEEGNINCIDRLAQGNYNTGMINMIQNNWGTIVVGLILLAIVVTAVIKIIKDKKNGKPSCGGDCAHCMKSINCNSKK